MSEQIINQGIACQVHAIGNGLQAGTEYTAVLYRSAKDQNHRVMQTATAENTQSENGTAVACTFVFTPEQTLQLQAGSVILEIYDANTLQQMFFQTNAATVRLTSLSKLSNQS